MESLEKKEMESLEGDGKPRPEICCVEKKKNNNNNNNNSSVCLVKIFPTKEMKKYFLNKWVKCKKWWMGITCGLKTV